MSVESCPKCGSSNLYHESKTGVYECLKCGHKWKRPTMKELMIGTVLDGYVEAARVKPLTEFSQSPVESEAVVEEAEIPTFTPAFLSQVKKAWETKEFQTFWDWMIEPASDGVYVRLKGVEKAHEFFPSNIIERMMYDEASKVYRVK